MDIVWPDTHEDDERDAWDIAWARAISLATRAAWVVARRVAFAVWMLMVAEWAPYISRCL
jgi:hypothetical protein